jgi:hypothetical protein
MTLRIVAAGLGSRDTFRILQQYSSDGIEARVTSDFEGARAVQRGDADYYLGSCYSGQGGALAAAIATLGLASTSMVGTPGRGVDQAKVEAAVARGVRAFGMTQDQIAAAVPFIVRLLLARSGRASASQE